MIRTRTTPAIRWASLWLALASSLAVTGTAAATLSASQRETLLAEAQAAYDEGTATLPSDAVAARASFRLAATRFGQLAEDGVVNGALLYNLGNAYLQAGDVGRAILSYREAEVLIPGDPRLAHNLAHARSMRRDRIAASGERALRRALFGWHDGVPVRTRFTVFAIAWTGFWIILVVLLFRRFPVGRWIAIACAALWLTTGTSLALDFLGRGRAQGGVVLVDDVIVRKGNGEGFAPQFEEAIHAGVEFRLRDRRPGWLEIELPNGTTGWIKAEQAGLVGLES